MNRIMKLACLWLSAPGVLQPLHAQISRPTEAELNAAPPQFQDLVHGRSDRIIQVQDRNGGPPPGAQVQLIANPSADPRDFSGYWVLERGGGPGGGLAPGGGAGSPDVDPRPGRLVSSAIDANRMCLVSLGVNLANMKIYQSATQLTLVYANELRARRIYFAAAHAQPLLLSYNGDSIAHWDGDTLVVDTVGIKGAITLLGFDVEVGVRKLLLATPTLHVVERMRRSADGRQLIVDAVWDDPAAGAAPYAKTTTLGYAQDVPSRDSVCEDVGDQFGPAYGGGVK